MPQRQSLIMIQIIENISKLHAVRHYNLQTWGCLHGVMVKAMDCRIVVGEFVLQSCYYVHFRANALGKGMNPLSPQLWVK